MTIDYRTVHFGHSGWTKLLVERIRSIRPHGDFQFRRIHVIDNSRDGWIAAQLREYPEVSVSTFPLDIRQLETYCHDHAAALSKGIELSSADCLVVLDCDAHILNDRFYEYLERRILDDGNAAICAPDRGKPDMGYSHPCFMVLTKPARKEPLPFDSIALGYTEDVGRLVRSHLVNMGLSVHVPARTRTFGGACGEVFDNQVYHHGSATFQFSQSPTMQAQVQRFSRFYETIVLKYQRYKLTPVEKLYIMIYSRISRIAGKLIGE